MIPRNTPNSLPQHREMSTPVTFFGLVVVPQGKQMIVERFGQFDRVLNPGWHFVTPFIEKIQYAYSMKEQGIFIPQQSGTTKDNVMVGIDGVLFLKIVDVKKASYNIDHPISNLINLAQTTMRSEIGRLPLDSLFEERHTLNKNIIETISREAAEWGVECQRYEIRDIAVSDAVRRSMDFQAAAEREKRKLILESEGAAASALNKADADRKCKQLAADAIAYTKVKVAESDGEALERLTAARARATELLGKTLSTAPGADKAVAARIAELCVDNLGNLAKKTNTVVMSGGGGGGSGSGLGGGLAGDPAALATQVLAIYKNTLGQQQIDDDSNRDDYAAAAGGEIDNDEKGNNNGGGGDEAGGSRHFYARQQRPPRLDSTDQNSNTNNNNMFEQRGSLSGSKKSGERYTPSKVGGPSAWSTDDTSIRTMADYERKMKGEKQRQDGESGGQRFFVSTGGGVATSRSHHHNSATLVAGSTTSGLVALTMIMTVTATITAALFATTSTAGNKGAKKKKKTHESVPVCLTV